MVGGDGLVGVSLLHDASARAARVHAKNRRFVNPSPLKKALPGIVVLARRVSAVLMS